MKFVRTIVTPSWLTPHRAVLLALLLLVGCAFFVSATDDDFGYQPLQLAKSLAVCVVVTASVTYLFAGIIRVPPNSDSWLITGLILFFVMPIGVDAGSLRAVLIGSAAAAASKYLLVWRRRLIINPVVAGALTCYILVYAEVGSLIYLSWWIATGTMLIPMIVIGAWLVTVIRDWSLVLIYLAASALAMGFAVGFTSENFELLVKSYPTLFFAALMLPEPLTSPPTRIPRLFYGALIGVLMFCEKTIPITSTYTLHFDPEIALGIGCLFAFAVRLIGGSARRAPLAVQTTEIANASYAMTATSRRPVRFRPGQWATVSAPSWSMPLWRSSRRVFSFASAPGSGQPDNPVEFAFSTSRTPSPYKAAFIGGAERAYLDNQGGDFVVPARTLAGGPVVLLASGIGITPFAAMLRGWLSSGTDLSQVIVVHSVRSAERAVYDDLLAAAAHAGAQVYRITDGTRLSANDFAVLSTRLADAGSHAHYYASGAPDFVRTVRSAIRRGDGATRLRPWLIHTDSFTGY